jgi:hypothetical protein
MILIDGTYFTGGLSLPNTMLSPVGGATVGVAAALLTVGENNLEWFVDKYVPEYLTLLLGREMAMTFIDEIAQPLPAQIWLDMKDQLLTVQGSYKASPAAN